MPCDVCKCGKGYCECPTPTSARPGKPQYELETRYEIWNNSTGDLIKIGPDHDGLGLVEIQFFPNGQALEDIARRVVLTPEQAELLAIAIDRIRERGEV